MNYTLTWRGTGQFQGELFSRQFERLSEMKEFAKAVIQCGCIVQHYSFKGYDGEIWRRRGVSDFRNYQDN
jgi:hypothetical protein